MQSLWKKLFIIVVVLLAFSIIFSVFLWYQLDTTETQLDTTKTELEITKTQLDTTKIELEIAIAQLDTTRAQLEVTKTQLNTTEMQLDTTKAQLEAEESKRLQMLNNYSDLRKEISLRLGNGQDCQGFITPDDPEVSAKVLEITGGYAQDVDEFWRDYQRLYQWVTKNIKYTTDSYTPILPELMDGTLAWKQEFWRMPTETLKDKAGDCEDMAVLLASMLSNYNEGSFAVWAVGIQTSVPEYKGHLAVAFPVEGNQLTILDPAGSYYTGDYSGGLRAYDVAVAVNKWLSHQAKDMPGAQIFMAFSDEFYREFSSTEEFIRWVKER